MSSQIYKKYNSQRANTELGICTAHVEGRCHYMLRAEIILADFNLAVSTQTAKPPNLIPHQIIRLYDVLNKPCPHRTVYCVNNNMCRNFGGKRLMTFYR